MLVSALVASFTEIAVKNMRNFSEWEKKKLDKIIIELLI